MSTDLLTRMAATVVLVAAMVQAWGPALADATPVPAQVFINEHAGRLGFDPERLARIETSYAAGVTSGEIPGAVILVSRDGELVYSASIGYRNMSSQVPMTRDTRFFLASMTKPVVSVAAMTLVEAGTLQLEDPVSKYLPELAHLQVGREVVDAKTRKRSLQLEPVSREPTIHDLLRHTSGFTYPPPFGSSLVQLAYASHGVFDPGQLNAEMVTKLAQLPLAHQPGTVFEYGMSTDVLGRVIEVVSGLPLDTFIERKLAQPLGMTDLSFGVADPARLALTKSAKSAPPAGTPRWLTGGGGLIGTADDYLKFAQMLLNRGRLNDVRVLSPKTVDLMASNHLPPGVGYGLYNIGVLAPTPAMGQTFGLGFSVRVNAGENPLPGSVGDYFWAGASGTYFWIDPAERLVAVVLTAAPDVRVAYRAKARALIYQALDR